MRQADAEEKKRLKKAAENPSELGLSQVPGRMGRRLSKKQADEMDDRILGFVGLSLDENQYTLRAGFHRAENFKRRVDSIADDVNLARTRCREQILPSNRTEHSVMTFIEEEGGLENERILHDFDLGRLKAAYSLLRDEFAAHELEALDLYFNTFSDYAQPSEGSVRHWSLRITEMESNKRIALHGKLLYFNCLRNSH